MNTTENVTRNKSKERRNLNRLLVKAWKGYGEIVIVDRLTNKEITLKIAEIRDIDGNYDDEILYGCNGYKRVAKVESILTEYEESD